MPRIFNYGDISNIRFIPDKELNILMYRLPSYLIIYRSHILLKMVWFFWPTLYIHTEQKVHIFKFTHFYLYHDETVK